MASQIEGLKTGAVAQAVPGQVQITIYKGWGIAAISGGDAGPGTSSEGPPGMTYTWSLPIAKIYTGPSQQMVLRTLTGCLNVIGSVAQTSCESFSMCGSGNYDGNTISIAGIANTGGSTPTTGQLQTHGVGIDLSSVNNPGFAELSVLPVGSYIAAPLPGSTKRFLTLTIES